MWGSPIYQVLNFRIAESAANWVADQGIWGKFLRILTNAFQKVRMIDARL